MLSIDASLFQRWRNVGIAVTGWTVISQTLIKSAIRHFCDGLTISSAPGLAAVSSNEEHVASAPYSKFCQQQGVLE